MKRPATDELPKQPATKRSKQDYTLFIIRIEMDVPKVKFFLIPNAEITNETHSYIKSAIEDIFADEEGLGLGLGLGLGFRVRVRVRVRV